MPSQWSPDGGATSAKPRCAELLGPGVHLRRGLDLEADLQPVAGGRFAVAEAELEAAELEVDAGLVTRETPEPEGRLVELGHAGRIGGPQGKLADAAHLPHLRASRRCLLGIGIAAARNRPTQTGSDRPIRRR